jgi:hypothetical protein
MTTMEIGFLGLVGACFGAFCVVIAWAIVYTGKSAKTGELRR